MAHKTKAEFCNDQLILRDGYLQQTGDSIISYPFLLKAIHELRIEKDKDFHAKELSDIGYQRIGVVFKSHVAIKVMNLLKIEYPTLSIEDEPVHESSHTAGPGGF